MREWKNDKIFCFTSLTFTYYTKSWQEKEWSPSLTAAFAFADSLTYGACGHQPIALDKTSWNTLIKVCCYRGAIFRALEILNETMPRNNIEPDVFSYNTILEALARVVRFVFCIIDSLVAMYRMNIHEENISHIFFGIFSLPFCFKFREIRILWMKWWRLWPIRK